MNLDKHCQVILNLIKDKPTGIIKRRLYPLIHNYNMTMDEILSDLVIVYLEQKHYERYDFNKGSLPIFVGNRLPNMLKNIAAKRKAEREMDYKHVREEEVITKDGSYTTEIFQDWNTPESECDREIFYELLQKCFTQPQVEVLMKALTIEEASAEDGVSRATFIRRLQKAKAKFIDLYNHYLLEVE